MERFKKFFVSLYRRIIGALRQPPVRPITPEEVPDFPADTVTNSSGKLITLVVGHNEQKQGANNYLGESEFSFNSRIARKMEIELKELNYSCHIIHRKSGVSYSSQCGDVARMARWHGADLVVCMHFNAYNGKAQGCEVLVVDTENSMDNSVADAITDELNEEYGFHERHDDGVKTLRSSHAGYGMLSALRRVGVTAVLIEPMFADNKNSSVIFEDEDRYVDVLISGIIRGMMG